MALARDDGVINMDGELLCYGRSILSTSSLDL
jgi:hypothetical protein